jgi:hypothetical protein
MHLQRDLPAGRALVIGCGPIGLLHSLVLLARGFEVWLTDTVQRRAELVQWCLDYQGHLFDTTKSSRTFDLVMVTASDSVAIRTGEIFVRQGGIVYLFAGLNTADRAAMDRENVFFYEPRPRISIRRCASLTRTSPFRTRAQWIFCAPRSTGIIPGLASPHVVSRLPGGVDWTSGDGSPAIVAVLKGMDLRERHCKLLVLPNADGPSRRCVPTL